MADSVNPYTVRDCCTLRPGKPVAGRVEDDGGGSGGGGGSYYHTTAGDILSHISVGIIYRRQWQEAICKRGRSPIGATGCSFFFLAEPIYFFFEACLGPKMKAGSLRETCCYSLVCMS